MFDNSARQEPHQLTRPERTTAPQVLNRVQEALEGLQYGQVTVIVQDGVVIQVERTDRVRLPRKGSSG